ncbi:choice-of-anchor L domain-containing protein [Flavobacterium polysaccharolyticum]|uniref:Choice-of-anchor L domain-containing protein n=1 Tax=Flavobacterium polysaccharolyticum TaxID=3133148 RepID=A0ABU9NKD7_9FLAO
MKIKSLLFLLAFFCFFQKAKAQYIKVDDTFSTQYLVEKVLVNSSCAQVSDFKETGDTFTAGKKSLGFFDFNGTSFPFKQGIFLSTWSSNNTPGPYDNQRGGGSRNWSGDPDLDAALGILSINATVIEFDFVPLTDYVSFNYFFASNEYQSYFPCEFSDGFAFLIKEKGSTTPYKNLAVLPGTTTPVSSKVVHPLINPVNTNNGVQPGCPAINENFFNGYNTSNSPINYAGQTKVFTAETKVTAGKTYHIKLVVADDREEVFDSAVFIEAGSFSSKIDLGTDRLVVTNNPVCFGEQLLLNTNLPATNSYEWFRNGIKINGANQPTYQVTSAGTYRVDVAFSPTCIISEEIKIEYTPDLILNNSTLVQCDIDADGLTSYDLSTIDANLKSNDANITKTTWHDNLIDAQNSTNGIANLTSFSNTSPNQILYVRASSKYGCYKIATVTLSTATTVVPSPNPIAICDEDAIQDGLHPFNLATLVTPQLLNGLPTGLVAEYYLSFADALAEKNKIGPVFTNTQAFQQTIYARIKNGLDCYGITPVTLVVNTFDPVNFEDETLFLCAGSSVSLSVNSGFSSYLWNTGATTASITVQQVGTYTVTITNDKGCKKIKTFIVKTSEKAIYENAVVKDFAGNKNTITINYKGKGDYEFSLDGTNYQDNPVFTNVAPGSYTISIRDKNGCGITTSDFIYVLDYPRFFTPNGDGYNDTWKINNLSSLPQSRIVIFDRYGKLLKELTSASDSWNGTFTGTPLPSNDYWFQLIFADGKIIKGHFSLKR